MTLHVSSKLFVIVLVIAALITAFRAPAKSLNILVRPKVVVAKPVNVVLEPQIAVLSEPMAVVAELIGVEETLQDVSSSLLNFTLKSTAYNSHVDQTDSTPHITATGAATAFGVIAVSRDMLGNIPYGSLVRLKDLGNYHSGRGEGKFQDLLNNQGLFIVEDTMHPRKVEQIDVWFADKSDALSWGVRQVALEVVRVGRDGPMLEGMLASQ
ncbi:MAG: 3D domain-containing protein [Trueperaceae bacterium]